MSAEYETFHILPKNNVLINNKSLEKQQSHFQSHYKAKAASYNVGRISRAYICRVSSKIASTT